MRRAATIVLAALVGAGLYAPASASPVTPSLAASAQLEAAEVVVRDELRRGEDTSGVELVSPDGRYALVSAPDPFAAGTDPQLVVVNPATRFGPSTFVTNTGFCGIYGCVLSLLTDGTLIATGRTYEKVFSPASAGADRLALGNDGRLRLFAGTTLLAEYGVLAPPSELRPGGQLLAGEQLVGPDGTRLIMQTDGNLVVYRDGVARWSSRTFVPGSAFVRQSDGNAVVYTPDLRPVFATGTVGSVSGTVYNGAGLVRAVGGAMVVTADAAGNQPPRTVWSSAWTSTTLAPGEVLRAGDRRTAPGGRVVTILQTDGNLVTYRDGRAVWASRTSGADLAVMQGDGNLVLYRESFSSSGAQTGSVALWATRTDRNPGARFVTQDDGNAVVYSPANRPLFSAL